MSLFMYATADTKNAFSQRFGTVLDSLVEPCMLCNAYGTIQRMNTTAEVALGCNPVGEDLRQVPKKIQESERIINNLLHYARIKKPCFKQLHLYSFLNESISGIQTRFADAEVSLKKELGVFRDLTPLLDPFQIREVLLNVLQNACEAVRDRHGEIVVQDEILPTDSVVISISDNKGTQVRISLPLERNL